MAGSSVVQLSLTLVVSLTLAVSFTPATPTPDLYYPPPTDELQANLAINQLAILHILNVTSGLCSLDALVRGTVEGRGSSGEECDAQQLRESQAAIESLQGELRHLQEQMGQLQSYLVSTPHPGSSVEIEQLREELSALNISVRNNQRDCTENGQFHLNNDCTTSVCLQGSLLPYQGSSAPKVQFSDLVNKNCIYLEKTKMTWHGARANCVSRNGDLFVAGDMKGAGEYIRNETDFRHVWVGVKGRRWLDGRDVADEEWQEGQPNDGPGDCADTYSNDGYRVLWDHLCTDTYYSLCQVAVSYPSHLFD